MIQLLIVPLFLFAWPIQAAMYKWVDENGKTVYSQHPPPSGAAEKIETAPTPTQSVDEARKKLQETMQKLEDLREDRAITEEAASKQRNEAEGRKKNCEMARKNLESLQAPPTSLIRENDGAYKRVPMDERQKRIDETRERIRENCR